MRKVDEEKGALLKEGQNEGGETTTDNSGPAASVQPKKAPKKRGQNRGMRLLRKKNRRGRKRQRRNTQGACV